MFSIPVQAVPSQALIVSLAGQYTQLEIYQTAFGLFTNVYVNNELVIGGVIGENLNLIVRSAYLGFNGDLTYFDTQGSTSPSYKGLGSRYQLLYLTAAEIASLNPLPGVS